MSTKVNKVLDKEFVNRQNDPRGNKVKITSKEKQNAMKK